MASMTAGSVTGTGVSMTWTSTVRRRGEVPSRRSCGMGVCDGEPMTNELLVTFWGDAARILRASPPP